MTDLVVGIERERERERETENGRGRGVEFIVHARIATVRILYIYTSTVAPVSYILVMVGISSKNTAIFRSPLRAVNAVLGLYRCTQRAAIMVAFQF